VSLLAAGKQINVQKVNRQIKWQKPVKNGKLKIVEKHRFMNT
jgi:hypothetical protein